jgi:AraC-like DNA-binding protein
MRSQSLSVTEIAFAVGYRDLRTFERAFGKCTGQCPKVVRKKIQSGKRM